MTWFDTLVVPSLSLIEQLMIGSLLLVSLIVVYRARIRLFAASTLRLLFVVLANILSVIAVIFLIIPIHIKHLENEKVILLTNGYHEIDFDKDESETRQAPFCQTNAKIYHLTETSHLNKDVTGKTNIDSSFTDNTDCDSMFIEINHISELSTFEPNLAQLDIYGDGLSNSQWQQLGLIKTQFYPSKLKTGFVDLQWTKQATLGASVNFTAKLQISRQSTRFDRIHTVQLIDVNGEVLGEVKAKQGDVFTFNFTPKTIGQHIYRIQLLENLVVKGEENSVLIDDPIAVNITESVLPSVLIIQSSPQYETKHVKHWLAENNGKLLTLTQISKNHVMSEEVNLANELTSNSSLPFAIKDKISTIDEILTDAIFDQFELLIIDAKALLSFESDKLALLENAVHNGLGLLINVDRTLIKAIESNELALLGRFHQQLSNSSHSDESSNTENNTKQVRLNWLSNKSEHLIDANNINLSAFSARPLVFDQKNNPLLIINNAGKGKVALTTITSSFQLKLNDLYNEYSQLWQFITSELASNKQAMFWLPQLKQEIVFKGGMVKACLLAERELVMSSKAKLINTKSSQDLLSKVLQINSQKEATQLTLSAQSELQHQYCSVYFSNKPGWQQLLFSAENNNQTLVTRSQYIYHYAENDWLAWQQYLTHSTSKERANKSKLASQPIINSEHSTPINKLIVFLVLFICSSFLWIERKLY